ncbi:MAG: phospho-N-acetylmuramoyl-pentapeptide-transferase [Candidatus Yanofskybacteria bacterium]|nr:phospho-N-acetylmuramoyl-pentapeptide-transferase [Candidatus Yanofskybacteria bacterium]
MYEGAFTVFNVVKIFAVSTVSFFVAILITPIWSKILLKYFRPGKEIERGKNTFWGETPIFNSLHKKKEGTPTMGGLIIWFTVAVLTVLFWYFSNVFDGFWSKINFLSRSQTLLPLGFLILAGLIGIVDDIFGVKRRKGLTLGKRLILFTLLAIFGAWWFYHKLGWNFINVPFLGDFTVGLWYVPIFILVIVATAFSADITDGLDGLSGGIFLLSFSALGAIAFVQGRTDLVVFIAAIVGALVAFLWFNIYPARFFMGDTGVMALGFVLGVVAMLTNTFLLLPIICVVFVLESLSVILQTASKKIRKKKIFLSTPIHHHFEALGWPETQVTMRFWMISAIGAILGIIIFLVDSKIPPLFK